MTIYFKLYNYFALTIIEKGYVMRYILLAVFAATATLITSAYADVIGENVFSCDRVVIETLDGESSTVYEESFLIFQEVEESFLIFQKEIFVSNRFGLAVNGIAHANHFQKMEMEFESDEIVCTLIEVDN